MKRKNAKDLGVGEVMVDGTGLTVEVLTLPVPTGVHGRVGFKGRTIVLDQEGEFHIQPRRQVTVIEVNQ